MKKLIVLLLSVTLVFGTVACTTPSATEDPAGSPIKTDAPTGDNTTSTEPAEKFRIAVCTSTADNTWMAKELDLLEQECEKETDRFEYTVKAAVDTADQQNIIETFLLGDYDLIMVLPQDSVLVEEVCNKVYEEGIPLFILDRPIAGDNYVCHVGGSDYASGALAAEYLGEKLGGEGNVAVLRNWIGTEGDLLRYNGFAETLAAKYPGIKIVREVEGENSMEKGYEAMSNILTAVDHIDAVYAQVDESGIGAEQAIRNANRDEIKYIVGIGGATECFDMMKEEGSIFTAIATYLPTTGMQAIKLARNYLLGESVEKEYLDPAILITAENVDEYYHLGF